MAVTKQTYTASATWTPAELADLFKDAFIDAGLMTDWHDAFTPNTARTVRVLKIEHDATKTFGSTYYYFVFFLTSGSGAIAGEVPCVAIASGWDAANDVPTGTQFLDYHRLPADIRCQNGTSFPTYNNGGATGITFLSGPGQGWSPDPASAVFLDRFTSANDTKQSWFVLRQGTNRSAPFTVLHKNTSLHPWLDLDKGIVSGFSSARAFVSSRMGFVSFQLQENIRRCLLIGQAVRGDEAALSEGRDRFHGLQYSTHSYCGVGSASNTTTANLFGQVRGDQPAAVALPVGKNSANPAFLTDYVPICTNLPWSPFTPTRLADDFGIYMHYADNTTAYGDKFIVQAGVNEWETLQFANNAVVIDGASATFLARVV